MKKNTSWVLLTFFLSVSLFSSMSAVAEIRKVYFPKFLVTLDTETKKVEIESLVNEPASFQVKLPDGTIDYFEESTWSGDLQDDGLSVNQIALSFKTLEDRHYDQRTLRSEHYNKPSFDALISTLGSVQTDASRLTILEGSLSDKSDLAFTLESFEKVVRTFTEPSYAAGLIFETGGFVFYENFKAAYESLGQSKLGPHFSPKSLARIFSAQFKFKERLAQPCNPQIMRVLFEKLSEQNRLSFLREVLLRLEPGALSSDDAVMFYNSLTDQKESKEGEKLNEAPDEEEQKARNVRRRVRDDLRLHAIDLIKSHNVPLDVHQVIAMLKPISQSQRVLALIALIRDVEIQENLAPRLMAVISGETEKLKAIAVILDAHPHISSADALSLLGFFHPETEAEFLKKAVLTLGEKVRFTHEDRLAILAKFQGSADRLEIASHLEPQAGMEPVFETGFGVNSEDRKEKSEHKAQSERPEIDDSVFEKFDSETAAAFILSMESDWTKFTGTVLLISKGVKIEKKHLQVIIDSIKDSEVRANFLQNFDVEATSFESEKLPARNQTSSAPRSAERTSSFMSEGARPGSSYSFSATSLPSSRSSFDSRSGGEALREVNLKVSDGSGFNFSFSKTSYQSETFSRPAMPKKAPTFDEFITELILARFDSTRMELVRSVKYTALSSSDLVRVLRTFDLENPRLSAFRQIWSSLTPEVRKTAKKSKNLIADCFSFDSTKVQVYRILNTKE